MNKGICFAGNMIADRMHHCERFPKEGEMTHLAEGIELRTGGLVCNCGIDYAKLDPNARVILSGVIGNDREGDFLVSKLSQYKNIDLSHVSRTGETSFTLVMNADENKTRTFFIYDGAGRYYGENDIDWDDLDVDFFHIGYILLLPHLDDVNDTYGTNMAKLLARVQSMGIKTSIDVVTEAGDRFARLVCPALKYTDYCIINEIEAQKTTGVLLRDDKGILHKENFKTALGKLKEMGVSTWAVIHCPEMSAGLDENNEYFESPSLKLPKGYIVGTTGAGDAFCAGVLLSAKNNRGMEYALKLGACAAAQSLHQLSSTGGVSTVEEALKLYDLYS